MTIVSLALLIGTLMLATPGGDSLAQDKVKLKMQAAADLSSIRSSFKRY